MSGKKPPKAKPNDGPHSKGHRGPWCVKKLLRDKADPRKHANVLLSSRSQNCPDCRPGIDREKHERMTRGILHEQHVEERVVFSKKEYDAIKRCGQRNGFRVARALNSDSRTWTVVATGPIGGTKIAPQDRSSRALEIVRDVPLDVPKGSRPVSFSRNWDAERTKSVSKWEFVASMPSDNGDPTSLRKDASRLARCGIPSNLGIFWTRHGITSSLYFTVPSEILQHRGRYESVVLVNLGFRPGLTEEAAKSFRDGSGDAISARGASTQPKATTFSETPNEIETIAITDEGRDSAHNSFSMKVMEREVSENTTSASRRYSIQQFRLTVTLDNGLSELEPPRQERDFQGGDPR